MPNTNKYADLVYFKETYPDTLLTRLSNFDGVDPGTAVIDARLTAALEDASDRIDQRIQKRYTTPLLPTFPDHFKPDTTCIAVMLLMKRKGYESDSPDENLVKDGEKCLKFFDEVAEGRPAA